MTPFDQHVSRNRLFSQHQEILAWLRESEDSLEMLQIIRHGTARHLSDLLHRLTLMIELRFLQLVQQEQQYLSGRAGNPRWGLPGIAAKATEYRTLELLGDAIRCADRAVVVFEPGQVQEAIRHIETLIVFVREYIEMAEARLHGLAEKVARLGHDGVPVAA